MSGIISPQPSPPPSPMRDRSDRANIQVAVRCRPLNQQERANSASCIATVDYESNTIKVQNGPSGRKSIKAYTFDTVLGSYSRQDDVFNSVAKPIVKEVLEGFNCTIFAYGQTGTGKTHTIEGDINSDEGEGLIPRCVRAIFEHYEAQSMFSHYTNFSVKVSFLELYNEELQDLLTTGNESKNYFKQLKLFDDAKKGVICQNLEEISVSSPVEVFELLARGIKQRQKAVTLMNKDSSRSHSIFTIKLTMKEMSDEGQEIIRNGQLNLVDLAGSECIGRSGATDGKAREAGSINQSLLTLGRVIAALVDNHGHIPYRDSKLTRLLRESLGGRSKTCIIATFSPVQSAVEETLSTLDYATRARSIKNQPVINQKITRQCILTEYLAEIEVLKTQLLASTTENSKMDSTHACSLLYNKLQSSEQQLRDCENQLQKRNDEIKPIESENDRLNKDIQAVASKWKLSEELAAKKIEQLRQTEKEWHTTHIQLKTSQAIIDEQVATESALLEQGAELQRDLLDRENDVEKLLKRVKMMASKEEERVSDATTFSAELQGSAVNLANIATSFEKKSNEHIACVMHEVTSLVSRGKKSGNSILDVIAMSVDKVKKNTQVKTDALAVSSLRLRGHLTTTKRKSEGMIATVNDKLSELYSDTEEKIRTANKELENQQNKACTLLNTIDLNRITLKELDQYGSEDRNNIRDRLASTSQTLIDEINPKVDSIISAHTVASKNVETIFSSSIAMIETTLDKLLGDLVVSGSDLYSTVSADTSLESERSFQLTSDKVSELQDINDLTTLAFKAHVKELETCVQSACSSYLYTLHTMKRESASLYSDLGQHCDDSIEYMRQHIDGLRMTSQLADAYDHASISTVYHPHPHLHSHSPLRMTDDNDDDDAAIQTVSFIDTLLEDTTVSFMDTLLEDTTVSFMDTLLEDTAEDTVDETIGDVDMTMTSLHLDDHGSTSESLFMPHHNEYKPIECFAPSVPSLDDSDVVVTKVKGGHEHDKKAGVGTGLQVQVLQQVDNNSSNVSLHRSCSIDRSMSMSRDKYMSKALGQSKSRDNRERYTSKSLSKSLSDNTRNSLDPYINDSLDGIFIKNITSFSYSFDSTDENDVPWRVDGLLL